MNTAKQYISPSLIKFLDSLTEKDFNGASFPNAKLQAEAPKFLDQTDKVHFSYGAIYKDYDVRCVLQSLIYDSF